MNDTSRILYASYPSWRQFSWLYLTSLLLAWRAMLFWPVNPEVGAAWLFGALALLVCAAVLRRWGHYELSTQEVRVRNGYTGRPITVISLSEVRTVELWQGPIARLFGIGTVLIRSHAGRTVRFRGVNEPAEVKDLIERSRGPGRAVEAVGRFG